MDHDIWGDYLSSKGKHQNFILLGLLRLELEPKDHEYTENKQERDAFLSLHNCITKKVFKRDLKGAVFI